MKISGLFVASIAAVSVTAASVSSHPHVSDQNGAVQRCHVGSSSGSTEKFAPRFDGLRFIETLITAHR